MRSLFALGLMALATGIPLCAQQDQQEARKAAAVKPPMIEFSAPTTPLTPTTKTFSSGLVLRVPAMVVPSSSTTSLAPKAKTFSSGLVFRVPSLAPQPGQAPNKEP